MQDRPDKATLLDAVCQFLMTEVRPAINDPALSFRVLVTANLASIVASEIRHEDAHDAAELERLRALMPDVEPASEEGRFGRAERHVEIRRLNAALAERIRERRFGEDRMPEVWAHVSHTLRDKLSVVNPRLDTRGDVD